MLRRRDGHCLSIKKEAKGWGVDRHQYKTLIDAQRQEMVHSSILIGVGGKSVSMRMIGADVEIDVDWCMQRGCEQS